ncbi:MAG: hypothetical protein KDC98_21070 [Planctomycetes bacterium]|nr:hypothetical protein [Planctomycetota bacterium]
MRSPQLAAGFVSVMAAMAGRAQQFANFESPLAHAVALSPAGDRLFAVNAPGNCLAVFSLADPTAPALECEIPTGLEPVAVQARTDDEVWVVDWLSDAVSIVSLRLRAVVATIRVGDEPGDLVFAGEPRRAFVSVSGAREVAVIDPATRAVIARVPVFGDAPRSMCRSASGDRVFVAAQRSGNGTTVVPAELAPLPPDPTDPALPSAPREGLIVRADDPAWQQLGVTLADLDVFGIDTAGFAVEERYRGVGTSLFDVACDPVGGDLWVANTEARNLVRFEPALRGHIVDHRVTRIGRGDAGLVTVFDLNGSGQARELALAQPTAVCFAPDGRSIYVAAFSSDRIAVLDRDGRVRSRIEVAPEAERRDPRRMRGPRALVHHPSASLLYVLNRLSQTLAVVDPGLPRVCAELSLGRDPTPRQIAVGRGFLHSAWLSGTGLAACTSCHLDGDWDGLAWDLGDPGGAMAVVPNRDLYPIRMHPMKGPMKTQTLRGLTANVKPFHHRGDRPTLFDFNGSFASLLGGSELGEEDLTTFVHYLRQLRFPPNPNRTLDDRFPDRPAIAGEGVAAGPGGEELFVKPFQGNAACLTCHFGEGRSNGLIMSGHLLQYQAQAMKVAQLRDIYKRTARVPQDGMRLGGFGIFHDGSIDRVTDFLQRPFFREFARDADARAELERFVLAIDTGTPPVVGWAMTVAAGAAFRTDEIDIVEAAARLGRCGLVVTGRLHGATCSLQFDVEAGRYVGRATVAGKRSWSRAELVESLAGEDVITFRGRPR